MIQPAFLQKNDTVAIVSTARKITLEEIQPAINLLKSWGLNVEIGKTIGLEENQFAGSDAERVTDFQKMVDNPKIKAIWCARGGYGTVRIIDKLDFTEFKKNPKWIIGYSDVTVLHSHVHNLGFQTLHATMPINVESNSENALSSLKSALFGESISYKITSSKENKIGNTKGVLVGGNLSMFYSLLGSNSSVNTNGKILFIEDLDEYLYHIDRMLMNLKRNGYFNNLKGLIVGGMTDMHDNAIPFGKNAKEIILDAVSEYHFPIVFDFPAGHLNDNRALVLGRKVELEVSTNKTQLKYI
ncbi:muramoyltetrapeptide carboxypeptidase [Lutibacter oricola]|uniref:Muramoyltetrapeptide carboxypeptidase n=1 Tax=Lutibacter oricola TaxID=762486 RepID=A0A1H3D2C2_9FLAO|nr:LD-carboxypeptidase [Lutibacter oricola]SDX60613.1 muramoyltetrapeptide carboxypeptidase [Lutibacter oricola]